MYGSSTYFSHVAFVSAYSCIGFFPLSDDLIVGFLGEVQRRREAKQPLEAALLICGRKGKYQLSQEVTDMLHSFQTAPIMVVGYSTVDCMGMMHRLTPKLNIDDTSRVEAAVSVQCVCRTV